MENTPEKKGFSYPNADRPVGDNAPIGGPVPPAPHPIVHIDEAMQAQKDAKKNTTPSIHTFQSDVANAIHTDNVSMIKVALAEKKRQERQGTFDQTTDTPKVNKNLIAIIILFVVLTIIAAGVWFAWSYFKNPQSATSIANSSTGITVHPPIEFEQSTLVDIVGKYPSDIGSAVSAERNKEISFGTMKQIIFTEKNDSVSGNATGTTGDLRAATLAEWLQAIRSRAPDTLIRSLDPSFTFGIYAYTPHTSFVLIKVRSYDNTYAGMLQWEPYMKSDLNGEVVDTSSSNTAGKVPGGTSTTAESNTLEAKVFTDKVINNKDVRVLLNNAGGVELLYSFIDHNTLVITSNEQTLKEIIVRLTTGRIVR